MSGLEDLSKNSEYFKRVLLARDKINNVSPTFCLAKWLQTTTYLHTGYTHSCHHPGSHKIEPDAVKKNHKQLHTTPIKIFAREEMLKGVQTKECAYCWGIENLSVEHFSDRMYKSSDEWALPNFEKVLASGTGEDINPSYLEVVFENTCNFRCMYCMPDVSSRIMEDHVVHGEYLLSNDRKLFDMKHLKESRRIPIHKDEHNPYIEAFWKWWPELYQELHTFRITGGEPLLSKHTWEVFERIIANPRADLSFAINSNMNVPRNLIDKLIEYVNRLDGKIKKFTLFTSAEAVGAQQEYVRDGINYVEFMDNVEHFLRNTNVRVSFMMTTNILSVHSLKDFLIDVIHLRSRFENGVHRVGMTNNYLRYPRSLAAWNLPKDLVARLRDEWEALIDEYRFDRLGIDPKCVLMPHEIDQLLRLSDWMKQDNPDRDTDMADFYMFVTQYDRRRSKNFYNTFPQLHGYMEECKRKANA